MKQVLSFDQTKHLQELGLYHIYTLPDILDKLPCFIGNEVLTIKNLQIAIHACMWNLILGLSEISQKVKSLLMQPMICCAGALKTDMLKLERRNNYGIYNTVFYTQEYC